MASITQAALAASVLVGMVSIPTASQSVDGLNDVSDDLPEVSASNPSPTKAVTEVDEDSFRRTVETPFGKFSTEIKSGSMVTGLESPGSRLTIEKDPGETVWELETSGGTLRIKESPEKTVETVEVPRGTLEVKMVDGDKKTTFEGSDREAVEERRTELLNLMEKKKQRIEKQRKRMKRNALPDVEVKANESTASGFGDNDEEFVVLVNKGRNPVDLEGWKISDPTTGHEFGSVSIEPRERLRVYSGDVDAKVSETGISWNDGGDTATLKDAEGRKIDESSY